MDSKQELTKYLHLIIKVGVGVLTAILTGFGVGLYIDRKLDLGGIGILGGVIIGVMIGFIWIFKEVMSIEHQESE
jgi:F0F1-type ATP synthase assembly protein I